MFLRRLRSFGALTSGDRALALRAILWLGLMRVALPLVSLQRLRSWTERRAVLHAERQPASVREIRRAMSRAERTLPSATCLARSLAAELLLRSAGHTTRLSIGVADPTKRELSLDAHAWIESDGLVVAGDNAELGRYSVLVTFSSPT